MDGYETTRRIRQLEKEYWAARTPPSAPHEFDPPSPSELPRILETRDQAARQSSDIESYSSLESDAGKPVVSPKLTRETFRTGSSSSSSSGGASSSSSSGELVSGLSSGLSFDSDDGRRLPAIRTDGRGEARERTLWVEGRQIGGARLPIIALTADVLAGTREQCMEAGMDGSVSSLCSYEYQFFHSIVYLGVVLG
jgi:CheY-like chemotaxis protein